MHASSSGGPSLGCVCASGPGRALLTPTLALVVVLAAACAAPGRLPTPDDPDAGFAEVVAGTRALPGLLDTWVDDDAGRVWVALPADGDDDGELFRCLVVPALRSGLGSNPVGLDRGRWSRPRVVAFQRHGDRVLLHEPNLRFRADDASADERLATSESFAGAVLFATDVAAEAPDGRVLIELTDWLVADACSIARGLEDAGQGSWTLDAGRSLLDAGASLAFPDNLVFEALLTFASRRPGRLVTGIVPGGDSLTLAQRHTLVRLPDDGYRPRTLDPRAGAFSIDYVDQAAGLDEPVRRQLARRHRLTPATPGATSGAVVEPIVYHVDRGVPEPVRSALIEGASWWAAAFEAAGWQDAYRVELLPEGVHPLDVRYNVIEWVHRSTRGWSYGNAISDPRTGEILRGHVSLGSLRVRQDILLFEGLLGADDPATRQLALARIRQLAAHEVGHTLGLAHNFAGSQVPNGSVMDYPAPHVSVAADGTLDTSAAYGVGAGPWDAVAMQWLYGHEERPLDALLADADGPVPPYLSDGDARPAGAADARGSLWDTGADAVAALERALAVRRVAIDGFGPDRLAAGRPLTELREVFAPVYLHHRYQLEATVKLVGGLRYDHALRGDGRQRPEPVSGERQRAALAQLLAALDPVALDVPEEIQRLLAPGTPASGSRAETLAGRTAPAFDGLEAAATAATLVVDGLLHPTRCGRLLDQRRRDLSLPGLDEVLTALTDAVAPAPARDRDASVPPTDEQTPRIAAVAAVVRRVVADGLMRLALDERAHHAVRGGAEAALQRVAGQSLPAVHADLRAAHALLNADIARHLARREPPSDTRRESRDPPPGSPIGELAGCSVGP